MLQIQINTPHIQPVVPFFKFLMFHTSTAFRMFIFINKNRNVCIFGRKAAHMSSDWGNQRASSPCQFLEGVTIKPSSQPAEPLHGAGVVKALLRGPSSSFVRSDTGTSYSICLWSFQCQRCSPPGLRTMFTTRVSQHKRSTWRLHRVRWPSQLSCGGKN